MKDKISVLIPTFNREKYIVACIESIMMQTHQNFEILIYDDGSTDKTIQAIRTFTDRRITLQRGEKNRGVSFARNKLLEMVNTKYAIWQDSDDLSNIHRLEKQYKFIKDGCFVTSLVSRFIKNDVPNIKEKPHEKGTGRLSFATILFDAEKNKIPFNEKINLGCEDRIFLEKLKLNDEMIMINKVLYYVRFHDDRIGVWKRQRTEEKALENIIIKEELDALKNG